MTIRWKGVVLITDEANEPGESSEIENLLEQWGVEFTKMDMSNPDVHVEAVVLALEIAEPPFVAVNAMDFFSLSNLKEFEVDEIEDEFGRFVRGRTPADA